MSSESKINVWGARVHNLKNIDVEIPRHSLTVITGLSGSGKSSLAFDTIFHRRPVIGSVPSGADVRPLVEFLSPSVENVRMELYNASIATC